MLTIGCYTRDVINIFIFVLPVAFVLGFTYTCFGEDTGFLVYKNLWLQKVLRLLFVMSVGAAIYLAYPMERVQFIETRAMSGFAFAIIVIAVEYYIV